MHTAVLPSSLSAMGSYTPGPPPIDLHAFRHSSLHLLIVPSQHHIQVLDHLKSASCDLLAADNQPTLRLAKYDHERKV